MLFVDETASFSYATTKMYQQTPLTKWQIVPTNND